MKVVFAVVAVFVGFSVAGKVSSISKLFDLTKIIVKFKKLSSIC